MLVLACCACGGSQVPVGPREAPVVLWSERWDNGRAKREHQYYLDASGAIVLHGYYREYSRFVDRLLTVAERYIAGTRVGPPQLHRLLTPCFARVYFLPSRKLLNNIPFPSWDILY